MKIYTAEQGQAAIETALTLFFVLPLLLLIFQLAWWVLAASQIHSAAIAAVSIGAESGNPTLADRTIQKQTWLISVDSRPLFSKDFEVVYLSDNNPEFTSGSELPNHCLTNNQKERYVDWKGQNVQSCVWKQSDGFLRVDVTYKLPYTLLPLDIFTQVHASTTAPISCVPSGNIEDTNKPYCLKT